MVDQIHFKNFAQQHNIHLTDQRTIIAEAVKSITDQYAYDRQQIRDNFDTLLDETEQEAYQIYLKHEQAYGEAVFKQFANHFINEAGIQTPQDMATVFAQHFHELDRFYLSLSQARRVRAGKTFEHIHNNLFERLGYPFTSQPVINGRPDFIMPSMAHYQDNPMDCLVFTVKRTLRERWRQIVTEGMRGLGFFLATIDDKVSPHQLQEMLNHRIYLVCPMRLIERHDKYANAQNVLSFSQFFRDHVDPAMKRWKRNGIITDDDLY